jgi:hypothetical protein
MENITTVITTSDIDCPDLTNNGLYLIFVGYLMPLISPTMRVYLKDLLISFKNCGKVTGQLVSLTEFGFTKVQNINSNEEMIKFIERICLNKDLNLLPQQIFDCAKSFSGDESNGKGRFEGSWNKLLKEVDRLHAENIMARSSPRKAP